MSFLPTAFTFNTFMVFGLLLLAGAVAGELAHRSRYLPRITGFMLVGMALGPGGLGMFTQSMLGQASIFINIALGLILFDLGRHLNLRQIFGGGGGTLGTAVIEATLTMGLITGGLVLLGVAPLVAAMIGAIGVSSSPAIVMMVVNEFDADGPVTRQTLTLLALNNIIAFVLSMLLLPGFHLMQQAGWAATILHPLYILACSLLLAGALYGVGRVVSYLGLSAGQHAFAVLAALVMLALGLSDIALVSPLLTALLLGVMVGNMKGVAPLREATFGGRAEIFFIILFVLAGAKLHITELWHYAPLAAAFVLLRAVGKYAALQTVAGGTHTSRAQAFQVATLLMPMAGLAIGMTQSVEGWFPMLGSTLSQVVLAGVAVLETLGPPLSEWALKRAGEMSDQRQPLNH